MLTAAEITSMRATLDASLPGTAVIWRAAGTSDGQGGTNTTWGPVGTAIARISPQNTGQGVEPVDGGRLASESDWVITFPDGTDVTDKDRVVADGVTFEATNVDAPRSWDLCVRVRAVRGITP